MKVPFGLAQAPAYFQELMTGILKDFPFAIGCLDYIIIFSKTPQEHLSHIRMVFEKLKSANLSMIKSKCSFSHISSIERTLIIKSIDGVWSLPHITYLLSGFLEPETKRQIVFLDW